MLVLELLKWAAGDSPSASEERLASMLAEGHERELRWVIDGGLGPMLCLAVRSQFDRVPSVRGDLLISSELTARVRHACMVDTAVEVIDVCRQVGTPVTLLKGVSTSTQYYPSSHLRPMGDIDVLVARDACDAVESSLVRIGYQSDTHHPRNGDLHHIPPLLQLKRNIWVELHTKLFPSHSDLARGNVFGEESITSQSTVSTFHQRSVRRLTDEMQLVYMSASWIRDLTVSGIKPSFLVSLFDLIFLFRKAGTSLDWDVLLQLIDNQIAMASLYIALTYLERYDLCVIPQDACSSVRVRQRLVGRLELLAIHAIIDRYLVGGRCWTHRLPLPVPGRYNLRNQLSKKLLV
ncbi:MAG: nucleotidyltransferase family protein [Burkholderiales bacterium]